MYIFVKAILRNVQNLRLISEEVQVGGNYNKTQQKFENEKITKNKN
jgi:hypothetical protein